MNLQAFYEHSVGSTPDIADHLPQFVTWATNATVIEIGVGSANSSSAWLYGGATLWSVDHIPTPRAMLLAEMIPTWRYNIGDSLYWEPLALRNVDIVFIDSGHTYDLTLAELAAYAPHVAPGGKILLHDTITHPPVLAAIQAFAADYTNDPTGSGLGIIQL